MCGLTENPAALGRWMVVMHQSWLECLRVLNNESRTHHEQNPTIQSAFVKVVVDLSYESQHPQQPVLLR